MTGNLLKNAGFLDASTGWAGLSSSALAVDETTYGAPGRTVLVATTSTNGAELGLVSDTVALAAGDRFHARARVGSLTGETVAVRLERVGAVPQILLPRVDPATSQPSRGLSRGMSLHVASGTVPTDGDWRLRVTGTGPRTGARGLCLYRPWIGPARDDGLPPPFDPGTHASTDLNLPCWPSALRPFLVDTSLKPLPNRSGFQTSSGITRTRRLFAEAPTDLRGRVRCTEAEAEALDAFHRAAHEAFWIVRPDSDQLCVACWLADGSPTPSDYRGLTTIVEVGLQLTVA